MPAWGLRIHWAARASLDQGLGKLMKWLWVKTVLGSHFGVGELTTHFRTEFSGDWDVYWVYWILTHGQISFRRLPLLRVL